MRGWITVDADRVDRAVDDLLDTVVVKPNDHAREIISAEACKGMVNQHF
jgi:hypothetical protein